MDTQIIVLFNAACFKLHIILADMSIAEDQINYRICRKYQFFIRLFT